MYYLHTYIYTDQQQLCVPQRQAVSAATTNPPVLTVGLCPHPLHM